MDHYFLFTHSQSFWPTFVLSHLFADQKRHPGGKINVTFSVVIERVCVCGECGVGVFLALSIHHSK